MAHTGPEGGAACEAPKRVQEPHQGPGDHAQLLEHPGRFAAPYAAHECPHAQRQPGGQHTEGVEVTLRQ